MKFEFDTATDGAQEASALVTALALIHGPGILDKLEDLLGKFDAPLAADGRAVPEETIAAFAAAVAEAVEEPSAADAFGAPTPGPVEVAVSGPVDSAGIPWDARIHAGTKTTNKDGTWSRRRNTPDALFDSVMAELKTGVVPSPPAPTTAPPPPPPPPATNDFVAEGAEKFPETPPLTKGISFPLLMVKITKAQTAGTIDKATVDSFLAAFDMKDVKELARAPKETVEAINEMVDGHVGA